jgi:hypothetical protein
MRFTKDQIDGICKDIRYPQEFFIDLIFDDVQNVNISVYEEDVSKWKNIISDFILKSYKYVQTNPNKLEDEEDITTTLAESIRSPKKTIIKDHEKKDNFKELNLEDEKENHEDDITTKPNTINKAQEILQKFNKEKDKAVLKKDEEDEDEEDIENYLKNLENK